MNRRQRGALLSEQRRVSGHRWPFVRDGAIVGVFRQRSREPPMMSNTAVQLAILADALTEIVDLASGGPELVAPQHGSMTKCGVRQMPATVFP